MTQHENRAFWKFFLTYFVSVALLILTAGRFYFSHMQQQLLEMEHFSLIEYAKRLKVGESIGGFEGFAHRYEEKTFAHFSIDNFKRHGNRFEKWVPGNRKGVYIFVTKTSGRFDDQSRRLFFRITGIQLALLLLFALLSYLLARNAIAPLQQSIDKLDRFAKDLIHDLNTPVTSIGLNLKALQKEHALHNHPALQRLQKSADAISELHKNLLLLLREEPYALESVELGGMIGPLLSEYRQLYPDLYFRADPVEGFVQANPAALRQILDNLLSNACKYSKAHGSVFLRFANRTLTIADEGIGIKHPERVFERNYTEHRYGSGIGLDIVKRLCDAMRITIAVTSSERGTAVSLTFR